MTSGGIRPGLVAQRAAYVRTMAGRLSGLPLANMAAFTGDTRTPAAAESYLRRALEALFDLGRHVLSKGFGVVPTEYRQIALELEAAGVIGPNEATLMRDMAGYRNRMVHLYHDIDEEELFEICREHVGDLETVLGAMTAFLLAHPERCDPNG